MSSTKYICVFCGSSNGSQPGFVELAKKMGEAMAKSGYGLVYGGGSTGLMGAVAKAVHTGGAPVLGIIPEFLVSAERAYKVVETVIVSDMHERKMMMHERSDAIVILPGGIGTLEEVAEIMSWKRLQLHQKPVVFLSENKYWDGFWAVLQHTISSKFSPDWMMEGVFNAVSTDETLEFIEKEWARPKGQERILGPVKD